MTRAEESAEGSGANPLVRSVSAFFPCYNDAHSIETVVRAVTAKLDRLVDDFEVVVVDGSQDESLEVLRRLEQERPCLRVVVRPTNRGHGGALRSGFSAATKERAPRLDGPVRQ